MAKKGIGFAMILANIDSGIEYKKIRRPRRGKIKAQSPKCVRKV